MWNTIMRHTDTLLRVTPNAMLGCTIRCHTDKLLWGTLTDTVFYSTVTDTLLWGVLLGAHFCVAHSTLTLTYYCGAYYCGHTFVWHTDTDTLLWGTSILGQASSHPGRGGSSSPCPGNPNLYHQSSSSSAVIISPHRHQASSLS